MESENHLTTKAAQDEINAGIITNEISMLTQKHITSQC
jgi:hypothetical protein